MSLFGLKDFTHFNLSFHLIFCGPHRCLGVPELPKPQVVGIACGALGRVGWAARRPWAPLLVQGAVVMPGLWLLAFPSAMPGAQAVVLLPPCLFLPSSQGFFTVIASELLFSFKPLFSPGRQGCGFSVAGVTACSLRPGTGKFHLETRHSLPLA